MSRRFSKVARQVASLVQGVPDIGMHADHIKPFSKGGDSTPENCQLLTPRANLRKGSHYMELREWQQEFILEWDRRKPGEPFLLCVVPGGGKTFAALTAAKRWMDQARGRLLFVVVPTANLKDQWSDEAAKLGIELQEGTSIGGIALKHGYHGLVTTYQGVASGAMPQILRSLSSRHETMVIMDEPHHCGDDKSWGVSVESAFGLCRERLLLSGTPWRSDGTRIPFVAYDHEGRLVTHFHYDYEKALKDRVVRWMEFEYHGGDATFEQDGQRETLRISQEAGSEENQKALRGALFKVGFVKGMLETGNRHLQQLRRRVPDAGGMVACIDAEHAMFIARVLEDITGEKPAVILSDENKTNCTVEEFRKSARPWLVAVRKVSEGTDIKRLQVLCYMTTACTSLFFRQLVGRVSRVRTPNDPHATVVLPSTPDLREHAESLRQIQEVIIREEKEERERQERLDLEFDEEEEYSGPVCVGSNHRGVEMTHIDGMDFTPEMAAKIRRIAAAGQMDISEVAKVLYLEHFSSEPEVEEVEDTIPRRTAEQGLRKECHKLANRLARLEDIEVKEIHKGYKKQADMSVEELERKRDDLKARIERLVILSECR